MVTLKKNHFNCGDFYHRLHLQNVISTIYSALLVTEVQDVADRMLNACLSAVCALCQPFFLFCVADSSDECSPLRRY